MLYYCIMSTTIQISARGTMTLPKPFRKALGVDKGGVVMVALGEDGIVLHPAVAYPIEMYTDDRIKEFDKADRDLGQRLGRKKG